VVQNFFRETWAEIDLDAIGYNIEQMQQSLPDKSNIIAVVKANAYGHGAVQIAKKALQCGAKALAVALMEEATELRDAGIAAPILVFGRVSPKAALLAAENDITVTTFQKEWIQEVSNYTFSKKLKVNIEIDTGMARVGLRREEELIQLLETIRENPNIQLTGVYTHFATADEENLNYFHEQQERFERLLNIFNRLWKRPVSIHIGNSAASIRFPNKMYHYIRYGIAMYGMYPSKTVKQEKSISLKQAFSLRSQLIHVKQIEAGESISYGATYKAKRNEWIGTIPIGYGDGWIRKLQGAEVLVGGKRMPIVGRVCMDQTMILLDKKYPIGTPVTLIGEQNGASIKMDEIADYLGTINYEIPCMINQRVPRVYINE